MRPNLSFNTNNSECKVVERGHQSMFFRPFGLFSQYLSTDKMDCPALHYYKDSYVYKRLLIEEEAKRCRFKIDHFSTHNSPNKFH